MGENHGLRGFVIHLCVFILVISILAAVNLIRRPDHIWFTWVLIGWGVGLAAHDLALLLQRSGHREPTFTDPRVRMFFIHLFIFIGVNLLLIVINLTRTPDHFWFQYPLIAWGLALAAHAYLVFGRSRPRTRERKGSGPMAAPRKVSRSERKS